MPAHENLPLLEAYPEEDLRLALRFVEENIAIMREEVEWLRSQRA